MSDIKHGIANAAGDDVTYQQLQPNIWAGVPDDIKAKVIKVANEPKKVGGLFSENYLVPWAHLLMQERATLAARASAEITRSAHILRPTELAYQVAELIIRGK